MIRKSRKGLRLPTEAKTNRIGCLSARPRSIHRRYAVSAITPIQTAHRGISAATVIMQPFKTMFVWAGGRMSEQAYVTITAVRIRKIRVSLPALTATFLGTQA